MAAGGALDLHSVGRGSHESSRRKVLRHERLFVGFGDVLVCGDRKADKRAVAALLDLIPGLRCIDAGRLEMARIAEQITALLIGVNGRYKTHAGIRLTALPDDLWPQ